MAKSPLSLDRLLNTPHLERIVPRLQAEVLHRVIHHYGLEQCAEFIALASPRQIVQLLDADVWRTRAGGDTVFDDDRFAVWLSVLLQSGVEIAAAKLAAIDIDLVVAGLTGHVIVFDRAAVSSYTTLDGEQIAGRQSDASRAAEIGGYVVEAKDDAAWDVIVELLCFLNDHRPAYFQRLMRACVGLSNSAPEADGFYDLLTDPGQHLFEVSDARERRRDARGYVTPTAARAFLHGTTRLQLDGPEPAANRLWLAYVRELSSEHDAAAPSTPLTTAPAADARVATEDPDAAVAVVVDLLVDAGVLVSEPRSLLGAGHADPHPARLALVEAHVVAHGSAAAELAYLANVLLAGCRIQGREFRPVEASAAASAVCNLGLEHWPDHWQTIDLVTAFQIGWQRLQLDVCLFTAQRLKELLATMHVRDRDLNLQLRGVGAKLARAISEGTPWHVRGDLEVLLLLDASAWAGLMALVDECPVINAAVRGSGARAIRPQEFDFIAGRSDIASARRFVESLPAMLRP
jgi:hypothetical protein